MHENELTMRFCVPCGQMLELRGEVEQRHWECPDCHRSAAA